MVQTPSWRLAGLPACLPAEASVAACDWALTNLWRPEDTLHLLRIIPTLPYRCVSRAITAEPVQPWGSAERAGFKACCQRSGACSW